MMKFVLFSAEHTGTNFILDFLSGLGLHSAGQLHSPLYGFEEKGHGMEAGSLDFVQIHSTPWRAYEAWGRPIAECFRRAIIPLRHPHKAYQTKHHVLSDFRPKRIHEEFINEWKCLIDQSAKFEEVCWINLETIARKTSLFRICRFVGRLDFRWLREYAEAWKPANKHNYEIKDYDLSDLKFAKEWYEHQTAVYR